MGRFNRGAAEWWACRPGCRLHPRASSRLGARLSARAPCWSHDAQRVPPFAAAHLVRVDAQKGRHWRCGTGRPCPKPRAPVCCPARTRRACEGWRLWAPRSKTRSMSLRHGLDALCCTFEVPFEALFDARASVDARGGDELSSVAKVLHFRATGRDHHGAPGRTVRDAAFCRRRVRGPRDPHVSSQCVKLWAASRACGRAGGACGTCGRGIHSCCLSVRPERPPPTKDYAQGCEPSTSLSGDNWVALCCLLSTKAARAHVGWCFSCVRVYARVAGCWRHRRHPRRARAAPTRPLTQRANSL